MARRDRDRPRQPGTGPGSINWGTHRPPGWSTSTTQPRKPSSGSQPSGNRSGTRPSGKGPSARPAKGQNPSTRDVWMSGGTTGVRSDPSRGNHGYNDDKFGGSGGNDRNHSTGGSPGRGGVPARTNNRWSGVADPVRNGTGLGSETRPGGGPTGPGVPGFQRKPHGKPGRKPYQDPNYVGYDGTVGNPRSNLPTPFEGRTPYQDPNYKGYDVTKGKPGKKEYKCKPRPEDNSKVEDEDRDPSGGGGGKIAGPKKDFVPWCS
ncbi:hypothetical protein [Tortoise microvirus 76]|nr:hypothetical protein [Tortoise microvirus 76]